MSVTTRAKEALDIALDLSAEERSAILDELLRSLQEPDPEIMAEWMAEARRRSFAYDRGEMETFTVEEVFADLDED